MMKPALFLVAIGLSSIACADDFMSADERKSLFCGKTWSGENVQNGWTYKIYAHDSCEKITIHYLTGDEAGKTYERRVTRYPSGENCTKHEDGKDRCTKLKAVGNGVYHQYATNGKYNGQHLGTITNLVNGNQLQ